MSLPCGHISHRLCALTWFDKKKTCPHCRHPTKEKDIRKIFLNVEDESIQQDPEDLRTKLDNLQLQERLIKTELATVKAKHEESLSNNTKLKVELGKTLNRANEAESMGKEYKLMIKSLRSERDYFQKLTSETEKYKTELDSLSLLRNAINKSVGEVNLMLHERGCFDRESRDLSTLVVELKKKLVEKKQEKAQIERKVKQVNGEREQDRHTIQTLSEQVADLRATKETLSTNLKSAYDRVTELSDENNKLQCRIASLQSKCARLQGEKENGPPSNEMSNYNDLDDSLETDELSFPIMDSPVVANKPVGILIGEKRKSQVHKDDIVSKKSRLGTNLMEVGRLKKVDGKGYNGFGGHSKPDIFPQPQNRLIKRPTAKKKSLLLHRENQSRTIDKFFGSFDSP